ncbi:MAG TPA: response regulator [Flavobacterium sp.]|nr:response regulator [Flavobacterium sp.]
MREKIICIIDDDPIYQIITQKIIGKTKIAKKIVSYQNGFEAIENIKLLPSEELPDIILLDIDMPVTDGWEFMEAFGQLQLEEKKITVYIVSSSIAATDKEKARTFKGIAGYLTKPIMLEDILKIAEAGQ